MTRLRHTHTCPGGCGKDLQGEIFACPGCTQRLPEGLAEDIDATFWLADWAGHAKAIGLGLTYYANEFSRRQPRGSLHSGQPGDCA